VRENILKKIDLPAMNLPSKKWKNEWRKERAFLFRLSERILEEVKKEVFLLQKIWTGKIEEKKTKRSELKKPLKILKAV
jgi:hypothetical protein